MVSWLVSPFQSALRGIHRTMIGRARDLALTHWHCSTSMLYSLAASGSSGKVREEVSLMQAKSIYVLESASLLLLVLLPLLVSAASHGEGGVCACGSAVCGILCSWYHMPSENRLCPFGPQLTPILIHSETDTTEPDSQAQNIPDFPSRNQTSKHRTSRL